MKKIILASASTRRKALLDQIGLPVEVMNNTVEEEHQFNNDEISPYEWVKTLSSLKAREVAEKITEPCVIIGADTIITDMGKIMEKPTDVIDAFQMLKSLQGRKHTVYTGMTVLFKDDIDVIEENYVDSTDVYMHKLTDDEIKKYLDTTEPFDKAGGYAIQGKGTILIDTIYGDFNTVVGLPLTILYKALKAHGIDVMDYWNK